MKKDISVIIPFLNEEDNIPDLCSTLDNYAAGKPFTIEAVFVDDGSTDKSVEILKKYSFTALSVKLVKLSKNYGSHAAIRAGISKAAGEYCMFFSADLQEPVELIELLFNEINKGYDLVGVQKGNVKVSFFENMFSKIYSKLMRKYAINNFPLGGINNFIFNNKIKNQLNNNIELNSSIALQILSLGFKYTSITYDCLKRNKGKSKWTLSKKIKLFIDSFISFSFAPIRFISILGFILALLGFIFALRIVIIRIFNLSILTEGWPTLISILMIGFGITNISLGIIAEYLWRTLDAARNRPLFIIDEEEIIK